MSEWKVHLEFEEDNSSKFWRARVEGKTLYVNFGRIGTNGQTQVKELASPDAALKELDKLEREKRRKGYQDAGGGGGDADEDGDAAEGDEGDGADDDDDEDAGAEDDEDDEDDDRPRGKASKAAKPAKAAAPVSSSFALTQKGRSVTTQVVQDGATLRLEAVETYASPEQAKAAFERLKQALESDGHQPR